MPAPDQLLAACVLAPFAGLLLLPLLGRFGETARALGALALMLAAFGCAAGLLPVVLADGTAGVSVGGADLLHADRLAVFMALVSSLLASIIQVYAMGYLAGRPRRGEYDLWVSLFLGAMLGLVFARHLVLLYACWEVTAIACWRLIGLSRQEGDVRRGDKAFLVTAFGAVMMLLGFVVIHEAAGSFDLGRLQGAAIGPVATGLVLLGLLSKSATLPLHTWLPDAGVAPAPVTALLHAAVLVKIGVYVYARLLLGTFAPDPLWAGVVPWVAAASALTAGGAALLETDLKRIIAYSTVSQLAFILLGLSVGGATAAGGALLLILAHAIAKGGLFLCAGVVEHATHTKDLRKLGGLGARLPITATAFALCAASVMGLPPFGGFFAKHLVLSGALAGGHVALALTFVAGSVLTVLYLLRAFTVVFLGRAGPATEAAHAAPGHEGHRAMIGVVAALALLSLASGLAVRWPAALAEAATRDLAPRAAAVLSARAGEGAP